MAQTENLEIIEATDETVNAEQIKNLIRKHRKFIRTEYEYEQFQEPVLFLIRTTGKVDWYEKVTQGTFHYTHSNGDKRFIQIEPKNILKFGDADKSFKGYIATETSPFTIGMSTEVTAEELDTLIEEATSHIKEWKTKELKLRTENLKQIFIGIAILIGLFILGTMLIPESFWDNFQRTTTPVAQTIIPTITPTNTTTTILT